MGRSRTPSWVNKLADDNKRRFYDAVTRAMIQLRHPEIKVKRVLYWFPRLRSLGREQALLDAGLKAGLSLDEAMLVVRATDDPWLDPVRVQELTSRSYT